MIYLRKGACYDSQTDPLDAPLASQVVFYAVHVLQLQINTFAPGRIRGFSEEKKMPKRTWLWAGISPLLYGLRTWSKRQKTWKSSSLHLKKLFCLGLRVFCE